MQSFLLSKILPRPGEYSLIHRRSLLVPPSARVSLIALRPAHTMASPLHDRDLHDDSDNDESGLPKRLVLCFDGTGDDFKGNTNDTNIVKLYEMFDRSAPRQMRYYQRKSTARRCFLRGSFQNRLSLDPNADFTSNTQRALAPTL